jgi:purine-nucleoside phosphorylase
MTYFDQVSEAAEFLRAMLRPFKSRIAVILGSGMGAVAEAVAEPVVVPYAEIPHFSRATVEGHAGRIVAGVMGETPVVMMQGRVHFYEGYTPQQVTFPMRVLGVLGIQSVILTNAAGGIHMSYIPGQLVLLKDHINLMGWNPLVGPNEPRFALRMCADQNFPPAALRFPAVALRFTDMTEAYSNRLRTLAREAAAAEGETLDEGVYLAVSGPSFETPAEIRAFRALGATLVGMSTVPETIVARHMGIDVLGISCVTNLGAGMSAATLSHEEVCETGRQVEQRLTRLLQRLVPKIVA